MVKTVSTRTLSASNESMQNQLRTFEFLYLFHDIGSACLFGSRTAFGNFCKVILVIFPAKSVLVINVIYF